jgi:hypothetical protein
VNLETLTFFALILDEDRWYNFITKVACEFQDDQEVWTFFWSLRDMHEMGWDFKEWRGYYREYLGG